MHRIDGDATFPTGHWSEGDPGVPRLPTQITAAIMEDIQEELVGLVLAAGLALVKGAAQLPAVSALLTRAQTWTEKQTFAASLSLGTDPDGDPPYGSLTQVAYPVQIAKAGGVISTDGFGGATLLYGAFGISPTLTVSSTYVELTLTTPVETLAKVCVTSRAVETLPCIQQVREVSAGVFRVYTYYASPTGTGMINPALNSAIVFSVVVFAREAV